MERHDAPNVTTMDDGPIPDGSWLAREERNTREYLDGLMDNALAGIPLDPNALNQIRSLPGVTTDPSDPPADPPADPSGADFSRQEILCIAGITADASARATAPAEVSVSEHGAPAPIPVSVAPQSVTPTVDDEELRPCSTCLRRCPLTDFVGVTGQRTRTTCNACCVCIR
jgi:hypothetical protein